MKWQRIIEKLGQQQTTEGLAADPFFYLVANSPNNNSSKVSYTVGRSLAYGDLKVSATVTLVCPQTEQHINVAGELAFEKAKELVDDGFLSLVPDATPMPRNSE